MLAKSHFYFHKVVGANIIGWIMHKYYSNAGSLASLPWTMLIKLLIPSGEKYREFHDKPNSNAFSLARSKLNRCIDK